MAERPQSGAAGASPVGTGTAFDGAAADGAVEGALPLARANEAIAALATAETTITPPSAAQGAHSGKRGRRSAARGWPGTRRRREAFAIDAAGAWGSTEFVMGFAGAGRWERSACSATGTSNGDVSVLDGRPSGHN